MEVIIERSGMDERYAAVPEMIRTLFSGEDRLSIRFGPMGDAFQFDTREKARPCTPEHVIASASFFKHPEADHDEARFAFYPIRNPEFCDIHAGQFEEEYLPRLLEWYREVKALPVAPLPGVERFLVIWHENQFTHYRYRFQ